MTYKTAHERNAEAAAEAHDLIREFGSVRGASKATGIPRSTLQDRLRYDPGIMAAMEAVGTNLVPKSAWLKTQPDDDGNSYSVQLVPQGEDAIERIKAAFDDVKPAKPVTPPKQVMADLCTLYPLMDAHIGMRAWGAETGDQDYDLDLARDDVAAALGKVLALTPPSDTAILLIGGDFLHADDNRAETPASKHKLDVDGRQFKVIDVGVGILADMIHALLGKHNRLIVRVMRGNHDENSHLVLTFALAERYRAEPRVEVEKNPRDLFQMQWGRAAIFAHHGDKAKPQQMALYLSDVCPFWSATKHRHLFTGHVHHDAAKDVGPLRWESLRAFCPPDAYAASMGYGGRRAMQAVTFHNQDGLVLRAFDPVARP